MTTDPLTGSPAAVDPPVITPAAGDPPVKKAAAAAGQSTTTVPPLAAAVATYHARQGGDGAAFLEQYKARIAEGGKVAEKANAMLNQYAADARLEIRQAGTYYQNRDLVQQMDNHTSQAASPKSSSGNPIGGSVSGAADLPGSVAYEAPAGATAGGSGISYTPAQVSQVAGGITALQQTEARQKELDKQTGIGAGIASFANQFLLSAQRRQVLEQVNSAGQSGAMNTLAAYWNGLNSPVKSVDDLLGMPVALGAFAKNAFLAAKDHFDHPGLTGEQYSAMNRQHQADTESDIANSPGHKVFGHLNSWLEKLSNTTDAPTSGLQAVTMKDGKVQFSGAGMAELTGTAMGQLTGVMLSRGAGAGKALSSAAQVARNMRMIFAVGTMQALDPTIKAAREAGWSDTNSSALGAVVAPLMAVMDAKFGVEHFIGSSGALTALKGEALKKALAKLGSGELTAEAFSSLLNGTVTTYGKGLMGVMRKLGSKQVLADATKGSAAEMLDEGVSQVLAERGVQQLFGYLTGRSGKAGTPSANPSGGFTDNLVTEMANSAAGSLFAGGMGPLISHPASQGSVYHQIDSAVQRGQSVDDIVSGLIPTIHQLQDSGMSEDEVSQTIGNVRQMATVAHGLKNHPDLSPLSRYTYYKAGDERSYIQAMSQEVARANAQLPALMQRFDAIDHLPQTPELLAERADIARDIRYHRDTLAQNTPEVQARMARKETFLKGVQDQVLTDGRELGIAQGLLNIDTFPEGTQIVMPDGTDAVVKSVSEDGQTLTTDTGQEVKADDAKTPQQHQATQAAAAAAGASTQTVTPSAQTAPITHTNPVPATGVLDLTAKPLDQYKPNDQVILQGQNGPERHTIVSMGQTDGIPMITLRDPDGNESEHETQDLVDSGDLLGGYSPDLALQQVARQKYEQDRQAKKDKLTAKLTPDQLAALNAYPPGQVLDKIDALRADKSSPDNKLLADYLQIRAEQEGIAPEAIDLSEPTSEDPTTREDALAADTPTPDQVYGPEVLNEQEIQDILDTDEVPQYLIDGVAEALMAGKPLSEWQTKILDNEQDSVAEAELRITEALLDNTLTDDGKIQQIQTAHRDPASGRYTRTSGGPASGPATDSPDAGSAPVVGPAQSEVATDASQSDPGVPDSQPTGNPVSRPARAPKQRAPQSAADGSTPAPQSQPAGTAAADGNIGANQAAPVAAAQTVDPLATATDQPGSTPGVGEVQTSDPVAQAADRLLTDQGTGLSPDSLADAANIPYGQARNYLDGEVTAGRLVRSTDGNNTYSRPAESQVDQSPTEPSGQTAPVVNSAAAAAVLNVPDGVKLVVANRGDMVTLGTMLTWRDGMALIRYETTDFNDRNPREQTKWVPGSDQDGKTLVFEKSGKAMDLSGEGPTLGPVTTYSPEATAYVAVPDLGDVVRKVIVESQDGNKLTVKLKPDGKTYTAYSDQSSPTEPAGWVDPVRTNQKARKSWGNPANAAAVTTDRGQSTVARQALTDMVARMQKLFPNVKVEMLGNEQMAADFGDREGNGPLGAFNKGVVYLNTDRATLSTPIHEFRHLLGDIIKQRFPSRWAQGERLIAGTAYEQKVKTEYPDLKGADRLEEALTQAIEDKAQTLLNSPDPTVYQKVNQWIGDMFHKISQATGMTWLSPDSTLDDYVTREARQLLGKKKLSDVSTEELAARQASGEISPNARLAIYPANTPLPDIIDEAFINGHTLSVAQRKELYQEGKYANGLDANGNIVRRRTQPADRLIFRGVQSALARARKEAGPAGQMLDKILSKDFIQNKLDIRVFKVLLLGSDTQGVGQLLDGSVTVARRQGAAVENMGNEVEQKVAEAIKGVSSYQNITRHDKIPPETLSGTNATGQPSTLDVTPSQALSIVGQYRSIMAEYGGLQEKNGVKGLTIWVKEPGDKHLANSIFLDKTELRRLENGYLADPKWKGLFDTLDTHFDNTFGYVNRTHTITEGKALKQAKVYFPLHNAKTKDGQLTQESDVLKRSMSKLAEDASLLKDRKGVPADIWAEDLLKVVERYNRSARQYVTAMPIAQNLEHIHNQFGNELVQMGLGGLKNSLNDLTQAIYNPNAQLAKKVDDGFFRAVAGSIRLATLSRFAFNAGIPLKQITGVTSAIGNGKLDSKYILGQSLPTLGRVAKAYALIGRGGKAGDYRGNNTELDNLREEIKAAGPEAASIYQRITGGYSPDVEYANFGGSVEGNTPSRLKYNWGKFLAWEQEYGMSVTQRADTGVIGSLWNAAKAQVADEAQATPMTPAEQTSRIIELTEHAMNFSNQTFDRTDKSSFQLNAGTLESMLGLYQGQGFKVFSSMALKNVEAALTQAGTPERAKANMDWTKTVAVNVVLNSIIVGSVNALLSALRKLPGSLLSDDKEELLKGESFFYQSAASTFQNIPVVGDAGAYTFNRLAGQPVYDPPFMIQLLENIFTTAVAGAQAIGDQTTTPYKNEKARDKAFAGHVNDLIRAGSETTGFPTEVARQLGTGLKIAIAPKVRPKRPGSPKSKGKSQIEIWLDSD